MNKLNLKIKNQQLAKVLKKNTEEKAEIKKNTTPLKAKAKPVAVKKPAVNAVKPTLEKNVKSPKKDDTPATPKVTNVKNQDKQDENVTQTNTSVQTPPVNKPVLKTKEDTASKSKPNLIKSNSLRPRLGPTGRHISDLKKTYSSSNDSQTNKKTVKAESTTESKHTEKKSKSTTLSLVNKKPADQRKTVYAKKATKAYDYSNRRLTNTDTDDRWRKKRRPPRKVSAEPIIPDRPKSLSISLPITVKDFAAQLKLKVSEVISKIFLQGMTLTINDILQDETLVQLLGSEFDCEIEIDTKEEERRNVTNETIAEEIHNDEPKNLVERPPIVAFMGHVDHGKTSLIDCLRKTNTLNQESGAITQHIGAFMVNRNDKLFTVLDTPGHAAFSEMRQRGAVVTDLIVIVVAGDDGVKEQTLEAINAAKESGCTVIVAINKCDKESFDKEKVYRQLSEVELLPEAWGGSTTTIDCSAKTGKGIDELIEVIELTTEILELKANPNKRARGSVIESEKNKGLGNTATLIVRNGTLQIGDCLVFDQEWARVKTMKNEFSKKVKNAKPSYAVEVTGLSGIPQAGEEFIVVKNEKDARTIAKARQDQIASKRRTERQQMTLEAFLDHSEDSVKELKVILKTDVNGSLEACANAISKIKSEKVKVTIIDKSVGCISESDMNLAENSDAVILGFHTTIERHAEQEAKQQNVTVRLFNVIYDMISEVKNLMLDTLDPIPVERDIGAAKVIAMFKSSKAGSISGCLITDGLINRNALLRIKRGKEIIATKANIKSIRREKDDVREVKKGFECGIVSDNNAIKVDDILEAYVIDYVKQTL